MKVAVIGSRTLNVENLGNYLPLETSEIVSGGAKGVDTSARSYARKNNLKLTEFLPDYAKYGRLAPLIRNTQIIDYAEMVLIFWDGKSRGSRACIEKCKKKNVPFKVYVANGNEMEQKKMH